MAGVVAAPAVAAPSACQFVDEVQLLDDHAIGNLEDACLGAIDQRHAGVLHAIENGGQWLQVKPLIEDDVAPGKIGGQIELAPVSLGPARKDGPGLAAVATQRIGHLQNALQVGSCGLVFASFLLCLAESAIDQVFHKNHFVAVRTVGGCRGLIVKRYRAALRRMEISQLPDVISCDHSASPASVLTWNLWERLPAARSGALGILH